MQNELLAELKQLKAAISTLIGTSDLPVKKQFSKDALDKAAKEFQKISIERGEWIEEYNISKYIKNVHYRAGTIIKERFGFSNYFKVAPRVENSNQILKDFRDLCPLLGITG